jgi:hypothetical protein
MRLVSPEVNNNKGSSQINNLQYGNCQNSRINWIILMIRGDLKNIYEL